MSNSGFKTKKSLGQNFLIDQFVLESIAQKSGASKDDTVVEIGPGLGALTEHLAEKVQRLIAVELDDRLIPILRAKFITLGNVEIVHEDILKFDWETLIEKNEDWKKAVDSSRLRIVGNLPYYITTPILLGILEKKVPAKNITVMVQKEVADRIVAKPGGKDYGVLSISLQYYCDCEKVLDVPSECFDPRPKVDSAVAVLTMKNERALCGKDEERFFALVKKAFSQRRKTLLNALDGFAGLDKSRIAEALKEINVDPQQRPETLSVEDYINLSKEIKNA